MPEWPVYVDGWQLECCGAPFAVGEEVEWTLMLSSDRSVSSDLVVELSGTVDQAVCDEERSGCIIRSGGLRAWVEDAEAGQHFRARGLLCEDHHGAMPEGVPSTLGTVQRIQMVTRPYIRASERMWIPKPGAVEFRDLSASPAGFTDEETLPELRRIQVGLLVSVDVHDLTTADDGS